MPVHIDDPRDIAVARGCLSVLLRPDDALAKEVGSRCNASDYYQVRTVLAHTLLPLVELPKPPEAKKQRGLIPTIPVDDDGPFKNKSPVKVNIGGWECNVIDWRDLIRKSCEIMDLEALDLEIFQFNARQIIGRNDRHYFSETQSEVAEPYRLSRSKLFVTTNLSANNAATFVKAFGKVCGYAPVEIDAVQLS